MSVVLYDAVGRALPGAAERVAVHKAQDDNMVVNLDVLGRTGLPYYGGRIYQERNVKIRGIQGVRLLQEMATQDPIIGSILFLIETYILAAEWRIEPAEENNPDALFWAEFVEQCLEDMSSPFEDVLSEILTKIVYGWSLIEMVFKQRGGQSQDPTRNSRYDDGLIGWRKLAPRAQDTLYAWDLDPDGGLRGFYQSAPPDFIITYIPIEKCLLFRTKPVHGNPEGISGLRNAIRPYHFTKRMQEIEAIGYERDLAGYPVMEVPEEYLLKNANPAQIAIRTMLQNLIEQVRRDEREGILLPSSTNRDGKPTGFKFSLLAAGGRRNIDTGQAITRYETRMCQTVLAEFIMLGMSNVGSFALASSKTNSFALSLGAWMDKIAAVFNRFGIPRLMRLNGCPVNLYPRLVHGDLETPPLDEVADYVLKLSQAGINLNDAKTQRKLRELGKLPQAEESTPGNVPTNPDGTPMTDEQMLAQGILPPQRPMGQTSDPADSDTTLAMNPWGGAPDGDGDEYLQGDTRFVKPPPLPSLADRPLPMLALNSGQINSMMDICAAVAGGKMPRDSALHLMRTAFPFVDPRRFDQILGDIGRSFEPIPDRVPSVPPSNPPPGPPPFTPVTIATPATPPQDNRPGPKKTDDKQDPAGRLPPNQDNTLAKDGT